MNYNVLRYFSVLAQVEHYTIAVAWRGISQPSLSSAIHNLETELGGVKLFEKVGRNIRLTDEGKFYQEKVDAALNELHAYRPLLRLYEEDNLPKAIELVREKRQRENTPWSILNYTKTLLSLLKKAEEQAQYETELRYLVLELKGRETEFVSRLKKITPPENWTAVFEKLLADAKRPADRMRLYHLEEKFVELFTELTRHPYLGDFQSYEENLRKWDSERTLKLYTEILKCEMDRACDRKQYRHVAAHLDKLKVSPNGQKESKSLAAYWYAYHKNRPAMKDELKKAGYPQE